MALFDKPLFTFEMANNHQGSVEHGIKIIREIGKVAEPYMKDFDFAFKFQYRDLDTFIHQDYRSRSDIKNIKRFQDTRLSMEQFLILKKEVENHGMFTMCTAFDEVSVNHVKEQNYDMIKIASCSFTDWPLIEKIAGCGLPVIASGAGASLEDVDRVVSFFRNRSIDFSLMHCIAQYPTPDEYQELNQITFYKQRYPGLRIGFSTHEPPGNTDIVMLAAAKGAEIFEKHVGLAENEITLNAYSASPEQVAAWLAAAKRAFAICGKKNVRYEPDCKELADLSALRRGVFAKRDLEEGAYISPDDIYLAFPCCEGQVLANDVSKYISMSVASGRVKKDAPLMRQTVKFKDSHERIKQIVIKLLNIIKESNVVVPKGSRCEISHHYGLEKFYETGVAMIECINREYCKKILILLPGQSHPSHYHKKKEETFLVLYGELEMICDDKVTCVKKGETFVVERNVNHAFRSDLGCVFEEISTTHYVNDSFYEESELFVKPRKTSVYLTENMLSDVQNEIVKE